MKPPFVFRSRMMVGAAAGVTLAVAAAVGTVAALVDTPNEAASPSVEQLIAEANTEIPITVVERAPAGHQPTVVTPVQEFAVQAPSPRRVIGATPRGTPISADSVAVDDESAADFVWSLPVEPTRASTDAVMASIDDAVHDCFDGPRPDRIPVVVEVRGLDGKVLDVAVANAGSATRCVTRELRQLKFPRFSRAQLRVHHSY